MGGVRSIWKIEGTKKLYSYIAIYFLARSLTYVSTNCSMMKSLAYSSLLFQICEPIGKHDVASVAALVATQAVSGRGETKQDYARSPPIINLRLA